MSGQRKRPGAPTPGTLAITPRDISFAPATPAGRWWLGGDPVRTAFFNALSATFPDGERFFMDAVRSFRDAAPPLLRPQIAAFLAQEAMHSREHVGFNRQAAASGYDLASMEARTEARLAYARSRSPLIQLAVTAALEHVTAILANALLSDPRLLDGAPGEAKALWRWHAVEEIEHKSVAFDTLVAATADFAGLRRWLLRTFTMLSATRLLVATITGNIIDSFDDDGINRPRTWTALLRFLFVEPGILRRVALAYCAYFRPGFHPWLHDNRALAADAARDLAQTRAASAPA